MQYMSKGMQSSLFADYFSGFLYHDNIQTQVSLELCDGQFGHDVVNAYKRFCQE